MCSSSAFEPTEAGKNLAQPKPGKKLHSLLFFEKFKNTARQRAETERVICGG